MKALHGVLRGIGLATCLGLCAYAGQQVAAPPLTGTGLILGRVVDGGTGKPVAGATVSISHTSNAPQQMPPSGPAPVFSQQQVVTGADGYFVFKDLPKGDFTLRSSAAGYLPSQAATNRPGGTSRPVSLGDGEKTNDVVIKLWKTGVITGQLADERGEAMEGVTVSLLNVDPPAGHRRFTILRSATTDDRGVYRFASLTPGDYALCALFARHVGSLSAAASAGSADSQRFANGSGAQSNSGSGYRIGDLMLIASSGGRNLDPAPDDEGHLSVFADACYSGASTVPAAQTITLGSGQERSAINLTLRLLPASRVLGTVIGPNGPVPGIGVHLLPAGSDEAILSPMIESSSTMTDGSGAFGFIGVTSGSYVLKVTYMGNERFGGMSPALMAAITASGGTVPASMFMGRGEAPPAGPTLWAIQPVVVDARDVTGLTVSLREGARVTGRIVFDGTADRPPAQSLTQGSVSFEAVGGQSIDPWASPQGSFNADETFATVGVLPGLYLLHVNADFPGWRVKSILVNGRDASVDPIEIGSSDITGVVVTQTDHASQLAGTVRGATGAPDADAMVVVFPASRSKWYEYGVTSRQETSTRASKTGSYTFTNVPAGDYFVVAIDDRLGLKWQDPKTLDMLSRFATRVSIGDGEKKTQDLTTSQVR